MNQNAKSAIVTNGVVSEYFDISRGIRQVYSMSALLYIIQAEPLAEVVEVVGFISRNTNNIIKFIHVTLQ